MQASDYADNLRDTATEFRLAKQLRALPEEERFKFIVEMLDVCFPVALDLAKRCLEDKDYFERLLEIGLARVNDLSVIKWWLEAIEPRLGVKRVMQIMQDNLEIRPFAVASAIYFLPRFLKNANTNTKRAFDELRAAVEEKSAHAVE